MHRSQRSTELLCCSSLVCKVVADANLVQKPLQIELPALAQGAAKSGVHGWRNWHPVLRWHALHGVWSVTKSEGAGSTQKSMDSSAAACAASAREPAHCRTGEGMTAGLACTRLQACHVHSACASHTSAGCLTCHFEAEV